MSTISQMQMSKNEDEFFRVNQIFPSHDFKSLVSLGTSHLQSKNEGKHHSITFGDYYRHISVSEFALKMSS